MFYTQIETFRRCKPWGQQGFRLQFVVKYFFFPLSFSPLSLYLIFSSCPTLPQHTAKQVYTLCISTCTFETVVSFFHHLILIKQNVFSSKLSTIYISFRANSNTITHNPNNFMLKRDYINDHIWPISLYVLVTTHVSRDADQYQFLHLHPMTQAQAQAQAQARLPTFTNFFL